ncbi:MAG: FAD-binding oxidoreductase [Methanohalobium sp.]|uniref:FAD-binding oxidoreductase n=1 Tax=Methanohalobium sp. TaxID=2837493 RepID=UPI00397AA16F
MKFIEKLQEIVGKNRVSTSFPELYCYSCDASQIKGMPDYVVRPDSTDQVSRIVQLANKNEVPITSRGAGTGLAGGAVPLNGGIVLDLSSMNRIFDVDLENLQVTVEPGVVHAKLNEKLKPYGFFFPPDPGSSAMCTIGGLIANNGSGMRSVKYGTTSRYALNLEVVMADGTVINTGSKTLKTVAGYNLTGLMVGSEGTLGIITKAVLKVAPLPKARSVILASFENSELAGNAVVKTLSSGIVPSACEILDRTAIEALNAFDSNLNLPDVGTVLMFEVDGTESAVEEGIKLIESACSSLATNIKAAANQQESEELWRARRLVGAAISRLDPNRTRVYVGEDVGVPIKEIPKMLKKVQEISEEFDVPIMTYGHIGDGNLHTGMAIDVLDDSQWDRLNKAGDKIHRTAIELGGTVSAEHGIGGARSEYLELELGPALYVMINIKKALDPKNILNPGKMGV